MVVLHSCWNVQICYSYRAFRPPQVCASNLNRVKRTWQVTRGFESLTLLMHPTQRVLGGIESQAITEAFGEFRTGKTQIAHTLVRLCSYTLFDVKSSCSASRLNVRLRIIQEEKLYLLIQVIFLAWISDFITLFFFREYFPPRALGSYLWEVWEENLISIVFFNLLQFFQIWVGSTSCVGQHRLCPSLHQWTSGLLITHYKNRVNNLTTTINAIDGTPGWNHGTVISWARSL